MINFVLPGFESFAPGRKSKFEIVRFSNGQKQAVLGRPVKDEECQTVGSIASDEDIIRITLLADALKRGRAKFVSLYAPYLAYGRQDEPESGRSLGISWLSGLLKSAGINSITTIDLHSRQAANASAVPIRSLSPAKLFADIIKPTNDTLVVAPDEGAGQRAQNFARAAGLSKPLVLAKRHTELGVRLKQAADSPLPARAMVVDDILDSGATLVAACQMLKKRGVKKIDIAVTHGLFSGTRWQELWQLNVKRIYVGNTLSLTIHDPRIVTVDLSKIQ
jgi:ribose-phosphate pyrophosphokinase